SQCLESTGQIHLSLCDEAETVNKAETIWANPESEDTHKLLQTEAALFDLLSGRSLSALTLQPLRSQKVPSEYSTRLMITAARKPFPATFARLFTLTTSLGPTRLKICNSFCRSGLISPPHMKRRCDTLVVFATSMNSYSESTFWITFGLTFWIFS